MPPDALDAIEDDDEAVDALDTSPEIDFDLDAGAGRSRPAPR